MVPTEMESLVTFPIESALNGSAGVRRVRSATAVGVAVIWVEFDWGEDIHRARQIVTEKVNLVSGSLPPGVERDALGRYPDDPQLLLGAGVTAGWPMLAHSAVLLLAAAGTPRRSTLAHSVPFA